MSDASDSSLAPPQNVHTAHDSLFKAFLANIQIAQDFFRAHLPEEIKAICDFETLRLQPPDFIEPDLKPHTADTLYGMELKKKPGYLYILVEHETTPDPLSAWRTEYYCRATMQQHLVQFNTKLLPIVIPLLFYRGRSTYPYPHEVADLSCDPGLARRVWHGQRLVVDLHRIPDEQLRKHSELLALLELAQKHVSKRGDVLDLLPDLERALKKGRLTESLERSVLYYFMYKGECSDKERFVREL